MKTPRQIELAMQIVITAFAEKTRYAQHGKPSIPTSTHSLRVGLYLLALGYDIPVCLGGLFHDVDEDTLIPAQYIHSLYGDRVTFLMKACTLDPTLEEKGPGEDELYQRVIAFAEAGDLDPLRIKCADSLDNLRTNADLKPEFQQSALRKGKRWLAAAKRFLSLEALAGEFEYIVNREISRIDPGAGEF